MLLALATSAGCLITDLIPYTPEQPVTPPIIRDDQGVTRPRLGDLVNIDVGQNVEFRVPVDDENTADPLQYAFFINQPRECVDDGGRDCQPERGFLAVDPNGSVRRIISVTRPFRSTGCFRVELWVSSRFRASGDFHTPVRSGDVDFATWWVFVRDPPGMGDGGAPDPSRCMGVQN